MKQLILFLFIFLPVIVQAKDNVRTAATKDTLFSPDRQTYFVFQLQKSKLSYSVWYKGREIIHHAELGLVIDGRKTGLQTRMIDKHISSHRESFAWRLGENDSILNNYNQLQLNCKDNHLRYNLVVRAFNGSIAFRYQLPRQVEFNRGKITGELSTFVFCKPLTLYQYNQESVFKPVDIGAFDNTCDLPVTLTDYKRTYISIGEADNTDYTKAELRKGKEKNSLEVCFPHDSTVRISGTFETPWRTISISNTAIGLHEYSDLNLRLVNPGEKGIPDPIVPGKLIRAQLSTASGLQCVDFASSHGFQYVLFDAGWYGKEFNTISDPRTYMKGIDIPKVIEYGKSKNIGVILYVNYVGLKKYLDQIIPIYKQWGVAGMKFGFVDGLTQDGIEWLMAAIKKANDAGFIIDVHDNYKPTGMSRKYPGLLTQEGVRGNENAPDAFHNTVLPFTRFIAGPADVTFVYPNSKENFSQKLKVSMAQQLALTVVCFSPLQAMLWYGKPRDYTNEQEIEFFKYVPTVWNESRYLKGEIGEYVSVARRNGDTWFIGNVAGLKDWKDTIRFDFLGDDMVYTATIYEDAAEQGISKRVLQVKKGDTFPITIKASGGQAIVLRPLNR